MGSTPRYGFTYPSLSDVPNVPADMEELATSVDAGLLAVLGSGVGTGADASTGSVTAQLADLRTNHGGVIARGTRGTSKTGMTAPAGILRIDSVPLVANRLYQVWTGGFGGIGANNGTAQFAITHTTGGAAATPTDARIYSGAVDLKIVNGGGAGFSSEGITGYVIPTVSQTYSFLFAFTGGTAYGTVDITPNEFNGITVAMFVEDLGVVPTQTGVLL